MSEKVFKEKEFYREKIIKIVKEIETQKGEILYKIASIVEILPVCECQRVLDYLSELYLS